MLIDTHAHLDEQAFDVDRDEILKRAADAGVEHILTIGINATTSRAAVELAERYAMVSAVVGIQPNYVAEIKPGDWELIEELAVHPQVVGIGETGLDRYWDYAPIELQQEFFDRHLELSRRVSKPFVVHCREAEADVVEQLRLASAVGPLNGVMHSFCGDSDVAAACLEMGMHISFAGMVTYKKNDHLRAVAARVPHDRLLVETDSPYLSPVPLRGKRNESANIVYTARCLAEQTDLSFEKLAAVTTANSRRLFSLP
ncbi:MAG: TatD family hydrolase [Planctomycetaceae bacterium]|nr:TatD family hydrolase [Planctomycetaceae bacterium]